MEKRHIVCPDDSNTHGYYASDDGRYDEQGRWVCPLQKWLRGSYLIIEEGLPGRTTRFSDPIREGLSGLDYIYPRLMSHEPVDLLVVMLEINDTKECFGAFAAYITLGLKRLVTKAASTFDVWRAGRANILVIMPRSTGKRYKAIQVGKAMGMGCAEKSEGLTQKSEGIASQIGCHYLDANTVVTEQNHYDFIYLTKEGYQEPADALTEMISSLFSLQ